MATNPRQLAFEILLRFEKSGAGRLKADSLIADSLSKNTDALPESDRGLLHALVMGTLRSWLSYDEWIQRLANRPLKRIAPPVRVLLRLGLFQLTGLDQVPAYAAIDTTVELARRQKLSAPTIRFVNAVLRAAQRRLEVGGLDSSEFSPDFTSEPARHLLWKYGWPEAFSQALLPAYTPEALQTMAETSQHPARLSIRVNTLKTTVANYERQLHKVGILPGQPDLELPECLLLPENTGSPRYLPGYEEGWFYVQDPASAWVSRFLAPQPHETILDLCAAPGSKTTHMAALMGNTGQITAVEPKAERLRLLKENLKRLGVSNTRCREQDGLTLECSTESGGYDRVLVDAPCSGSGTLRRHPEILLQLRKLKLHDYVIQQRALLEKGLACLKPGGILVYSTCSILPDENSRLVAAVLQAHPEVSLLQEEQRLITHDADGFYAARIMKDPV